MELANIMFCPNIINHCVPKTEPTARKLEFRDQFQNNIFLEFINLITKKKTLLFCINQCLQ